MGWWVMMLYNFLIDKIKDMIIFFIWANIILFLLFTKKLSGL
jgi:hypothetical protein